MVLKKIDNRLRVAIENGVEQRHRTMFVITGEKARDQVVILHHMLSKCQVKARPAVLWCYKKELGFTSHRKKRMKQLQKKLKSGTLDLKKDDPFELFIAATTIRYCYYNETHTILGNTFGMLVLQDFEAMTPNLLARTIETVEGGGVICILLKTMSSLKKLYTMAMDVHSRYRTESHQDVIGRFNERFLLSLANCKSCFIVDDDLQMLSISSSSLSVSSVAKKSMSKSLSSSDMELKDLKESLQDTQPIGSIVSCCKTLDQAKALLKFIETISEKTLRSTVTLTAARGRGKSAALGLAISTAISFGYSNIFVTSPSPENLKTLFEFVLKGFDALEYQEHLDFELIQSTNPDFNKAVVRVNVFRDHRQTIQYIEPVDCHKLGQAELLVIDEAAAIPLPIVKKLLGPYLIFMASTINGYEGTGRSLSLKLISQLRTESAPTANTAPAVPTEMKNGDLATTTVTTPTGRMLQELSLNESIRYANGDHIEKWLNELLCLDATVVPRINSGCPLPEKCDLYYINRDTLFSYHKASEVFLQRIMSLYVASHYKNSPNDLQLMSDAPAHHLFCLLGPVTSTQTTLPEVFCVIQVCLEGEISKESIQNSLSRGKRASGDMIPWTISQQFNDNDFAGLSGARVVRIATHPDFQRMGYGRRALQQLIDYYELRIANISESSEETTESEAAKSISTSDGELQNEMLTPRENLPPLLLKLGERKPEALDYVGVSFGLTSELSRFWKRSGFVPVYIRQTANDLTGEHSTIMLRLLHEDRFDDPSTNWLLSFWKDFRRRFLTLLSYQFRSFPTSLGLSLTQCKIMAESSPSHLNKNELDFSFTPYDLKRLELYSQNMVDYHLIMDLLPTVATLYFLGKNELSLSAVQSAILLGMGLQRKSVDDVSKEMSLPSTQVLGLFNRMMRKFVQSFNGIMESVIEQSLSKEKAITMEPTRKTLNQELAEAEKDMSLKQEQELKKLSGINFGEYAITGSEQDWDQVLKKSKSFGNVSLKTDAEKREKRDKKRSTNEKTRTPKSTKKSRK